MTAQVEATVDAQRVCQYMHRALESLVEALESEPSRPMRFLEVLPEAERQQMLYEWNATEAEYPREKLVHELFEEQVEETPDAVAVVFEDAMLSYAELNRRANQLAHYLRELEWGRMREWPSAGAGTGDDGRLARGVEGRRGYVPLDPAYPVERLQYMLEDSAPAALLTQGRWQGLFSEVGEKLAVVELDEAVLSSRQQPESNPDAAQVGLRHQHSAYVIYTSGSTGRPKGVVVTHQNVARLFSATENCSGSMERIFGRCSIPMPSTFRFGRCGVRCCMVGE